MIRRHGAPLVAAPGRRQPAAPASPAGRPRCLPALLAPSGQGLRALLACLPPPTEQGSREQLQGAVAAAASYRPACAPAGLPPVPCASAQRPNRPPLRPCAAHSRPGLAAPPPPPALPPPLGIGRVGRREGGSAGKLGRGVGRGGKEGACGPAGDRGPLGWMGSCGLFVILEPICTIRVFVFCFSCIYLRNAYVYKICQK